MVRSTTWLLLGCLGLCLAGCGGGGGDANKPAANNAPAPAAAGAPPGMAGAPPGMPMPGPPAMPGMPGVGAPGGPAAAAPAAAAATPKDPMVYLPGNVTFAVGGLPAAVAKSTNKVAATFLVQFSPLTSALAKFGLPAQGFDGFWAAGNTDMSEQALCVVTNADINQEALKLALGGANLPKDSRVWPLPGEAAATHAIAIADSRTVIIGRKTTVEAALRKSPALVIKQGLGTINQVDADFWMAGDAAAAETYFHSGLPLLGSYHTPIKDLKAFGVGIILEGKTLTATATNGTGGMMGSTSMGPPGMGGPPASGPMGGGYSPMGPMGGYSPMGPMGPMGSPMAGGGTPAGATATAAATDQNGVTVMVGLVFESDATAVAAKAPLDAFLTAAAKKKGPKSGRYMPDLLGTGGGGNSPYGAMGMMPGGAMPMPNGGPPSGNYAGGPSSQSGANKNIPVMLEPAPVAAAAPIDMGLKLVTPPPAQVVSATPPGDATATTAGATPMPGAPGGPMGYSSGPMGYAPGGPMAGGAPSPMPMTPMGPYAGAGQGYAGPGMNGGMPGAASNNTGFAGQWIQQQGAIAQFAYRFNAHDESVAFASHLLRALGVSPLGDPLSTGPLAALHKAAEQWRAAGASGGGAKGGFGPQGSSWMVHLLPYLGHEGLYKKIDFTRPLSDPKNINVTHAVIPEFLNPADSRQQWSGAPYAGMGLTHFAGMSGIEDEHGAPAALLPRNDPKAGIFGYDGVATPEMITDGQSQTIMMVGSGELAAPWSVGGGATIRGARPKSFSPHVGFGSTGGPKPGAYVLFADGSVRFVAADVDENVFKAMSTTHGKETVDLQGLQSAGSLAGK